MKSRSVLVLLAILGGMTRTAVAENTEVVTAVASETGIDLSGVWRYQVVSQVEDRLFASSTDDSSWPATIAPGRWSDQKIERGDLTLSLEVLTFTSTPIASIIESALGHDAAGIVVLGTELSVEDIQGFSAVRTPLVFIDTYHGFLPFDFVDMNNEDSVFAIVEHFASRGHRQIGFVKGSIETRNIRLREEGFVESLTRCGLPFDPGLVYSVDLTFHGAYEDMAALLRGGARMPSALFCANDIIACGCLRAFSEAGIRVPDDVSMIGFDDLPLAARTDPPLTTIEVSKAHIGRLAVQLLTNRIDAPAQAPPVKVLVAGKLVPRKSVKDFEEARSEGAT